MQVVCVGERTVYRVLSDADLLSRWKRSVASSGEYNFRPNGPNQQWHTDVIYVCFAARFCSLLKQCPRLLGSNSLTCESRGVC
jgi:hypothetical protein